ncbi:general transcriptional corepressor CYC8 [Nematocida sp. AWRm80]|nr:general transcriptional corepressor CYC8 [Nematocida sp. AWRm80]
MDSDNMISSQEEWRGLPGLENVPSVPKKINSDIYTKLLLENEAAWVSIANLFKECKMEKNVVYAYERALSNNPMSREGLYELGPIYRKKKDFSKALDVYLRLFKLSEGEDYYCAANIGYCYLLLDRFSESLLWYKLAARNASKIKEKKGFLWYGIGVLYERLNNLQIAEEAYASAIKIDLSFDYVMETYFRLGVTYKKRGAVQTAMDCFEYLIHNLGTHSYSPSKEDVMIQIAHIHELQSRDQESIDLLKDVYQISPGNEKGLLLLSWLSYKENNWTAARDILKSKAQEGILSAFSWYMIGRCEQKLENFTEAYAAYNTALKKDPQNHFYWNSLGTLYFSLSQFEDARGAFVQAKSYNPGFIEAIYNLGVVYEQFASALDNALDLYERALEMFPEDRLIMERIEDLEARNAIEPEELPPYTPPEIPLRDIIPNPTKTPYFLPHALLGYKPTTFIFTKAEKEEAEKLVKDLHRSVTVA